MIRAIVLFFPLSLMADTSGNLLSQDFTNGWTGTNQSSRHGTSTIAGVDNNYVESSISLSDTLSASQINGGWTSTLGADIWSWNNNDQTTTMKQTITNADGEVTTQIRNISTTSSDNYTTYTDSYTQGINSQSDYDIAVRFSFDESSNSSGHYATDLKNPILTIEYSLLDTTQVEEISTMSETVYNVVEDIEFYEYIPEEFNFEITEQPMIEMSMIEEFYFEPQAIEELNSGVVDVFQEITYDNPETFEEVTTEIEINEVYEERETDIQTADNSGIIESTPVREEASTGTGGEITEEEVSVGTSTDTPPKENEETVAAEPEPEQDQVVETEPTDEPREEVTTLVESETDVQPSPREDTVSVSIEDIREQVNQTTRSIDERLVQTSLLVAKAMQNPVALSTYSNINDGIFNNQLQIDGGNLDEYNQISYIDNREIYATISFKDQDLLAKYDQRVTETVSNRIRAEQELQRIINGY